MKKKYIPTKFRNWTNNFKIEDFMLEFSNLKDSDEKVDKVLNYLDTQLAPHSVNLTLKEYRDYYEKFCPDFYKIIELFREVRKYPFEEQEGKVKEMFAKKNYFLENI